MGRLSYLLDSNMLSEPSRPHPNVQEIQGATAAHDEDGMLGIHARVLLHEGAQARPCAAASAPQ